MVLINFGIFATWAIMYRFNPEAGIQAFVELGFRSAYLDAPELRLLTLISAMFMHATPMHLLMNMLILFLLGAPFEDRIGSAAFLKIYLISGILGSLITASISVWDQSGLNVINIGASGAVLALWEVLHYSTLGMRFLCFLALYSCTEFQYCLQP